MVSDRTRFTRVHVLGKENAVVYVDAGLDTRSVFAIFTTVETENMKSIIGRTVEL